MARPGPLPLPRRAYGRVRRFLRDARAGATGIAAVAVTVMTVGGMALVGDHVWLVDQRDVLKSAADAATVAATIEMKRLRAAHGQMSDAALRSALEPIARRYVLLNFGHLPEDRFDRARDTLVVVVTPNQDLGTVEVVAQADLGGTLFARHLPLFDGFVEDEDGVRVESGVECVGLKVELVLAIDVSHSMDIAFGGGQRRIEAVMDAANALVEVLYGACSDSQIAVGIVPWDRTVRLPGPRTWIQSGEVDTSGYDSLPDDWGGCVEDRAHDLAAPASSPALSLALPSDAPFRAYLYPDTSSLAARIVGPASDEIERELVRRYGALPGGLGRAQIETFVRDRMGDNAWGQPLRDHRHPTSEGGPNAYCPTIPILSLTRDRRSIEATLLRLKSLRGDGLWVGMTLHHVGMTWARRLLAPAWRAVWRAPVHPIDPEEEDVVKAIVLLSDGEVQVGDRFSTLPGRAQVLFSSQIPGFLRRPTGSFCNACLQIDGYVSAYGAAGRIGEDIMPDEGGRIGWSAVTRRWRPSACAPAREPSRWKRHEARANCAFTQVAHASCDLAKSEGIDVYTVSVATGGAGGQHARALLEGCAGGAPGSSPDAEYAFQADDVAALETTFQKIAQRLFTVRRVR